jgi:hypothetical protein
VKGRRLQLTADGKVPFEEMTQPGDYCGPVIGYSGPDRPAVFYKLPVEAPHGADIGHVCSPPHVFRECPDGSLEIRESILHSYHYYDGDPHDPIEQRHELTFQWHGYLDEGHNWRTV